ncbi:MAG: hypothetical protein V1828_03990 [Candidatus Omnitrophota bacterium]
MSIINEALKKVEKSIEGFPVKETKTAPQALRPGRAINRYLVYALILCFGLFIENTFFLFFFKPQNAYPVSKTPLYTPAQEDRIQPLSAITDPVEEVIAENSPAQTLQPALTQDTVAENEPPGPTTALVLNGIFFSQGDGYYALINNKIVKVGDDIDGAIVKHIDFDNVELESEAGSLVKLSRGR